MTFPEARNKETKNVNFITFEFIISVRSVYLLNIYRGLSPLLIRPFIPSGQRIIATA